MTAQRIVTASVSTNSKKKVPDNVLNVALVSCLSSPHRENHPGTDGLRKPTAQLKPDLRMPTVLLCAKDFDKEIRVNFSSILQALQLCIAL